MVQAPIAKEVLLIRVARQLHVHGYVAANCSGKAMKELEAESGYIEAVGILREPPIPPESREADNSQPMLDKVITWIADIGKPRSRRVWLGTIWLGHNCRGSSPEHWIFEIHGNGNKVEAQTLASRLMATFNVTIDLQIITEKLRYEYV
jgi:hypothetical protein